METSHRASLLNDFGNADQVATFYGIMIETDYVKKEKFNTNFWAGFKKVCPAELLA